MRIYYVMLWSGTQPWKSFFLKKNVIFLKSFYKIKLYIELATCSAVRPKYIDPQEIAVSTRPHGEVAVLRSRNCTLSALEIALTSFDSAEKISRVARHRPRTSRNTVASHIFDFRMSAPGSRKLSGIASNPRSKSLCQISRYSDCDPFRWVMKLRKIRMFFQIKLTFLIENDFYPLVESSLRNQGSMDQTRTVRNQVDRTQTTEK